LLLGLETGSDADFQRPAHNGERKTAGSPTRNPKRGDYIPGWAGSKQLSVRIGKIFWWEQVKSQEIAISYQGVCKILQLCPVKGSVPKQSF